MTWLIMRDGKVQAEAGDDFKLDSASSAAVRKIWPTGKLPARYGSQKGRNLFELSLDVGRSHALYPSALSDHLVAEGGYILVKGTR